METPNTSYEASVSVSVVVLLKEKPPRAVRHAVGRGAKGNDERETA